MQVGGSGSFNGGTEIAGGGDNSFLGSILGSGSGSSSSEGLVGNILNGLLGGGPSKSGYIDPVKQNLAPGKYGPARKQDGFLLKDIWAYSPPAGLVQGVLQAVLGGKKTAFLLRRTKSGPACTGSVVSETKKKYKVTRNSFGGICCRQDIAVLNACVPVACILTVTGLVKGKVVGTMKYSPGNVYSGKDVEADECKLSYTPVKGTTPTLDSVIVNLGVYLV